jgi:hypothetical protein
MSSPSAIAQAYDSYSDKMLDSHTEEWGDCPECGAGLVGRADKYTSELSCEEEDCEYETSYEADFEGIVESRRESY